MCVSDEHIISISETFTHTRKTAKPCFLVLSAVAICLICGGVLYMDPGTQFSCHRKWSSNHLFLTVKTTSNNHASRLTGLLQTWIPYALSLRDLNGSDVVKQITIVTDAKYVQNLSIAPEDGITDSSPSRRLGRTVKFRVVEYCGNTHDSESLACKMQEEFRSYFLAGGEQAKWFCHFDDDTYVNIANLVESLSGLTDPIQTSYFVGKIPVVRPLGFTNFTKGLSGDKPPRNVRWLTGQAICMSRHLMARLKRVTEQDRHWYNFWRIAHRFPTIPDDLILSIFVQEVLKVPMTEITTFYNQHDDVEILSHSELFSVVTLPLPRSLRTSLPDINGESRPDRTSHSTNEEVIRLANLHHHIMSDIKGKCI